MNEKYGHSEEFYDVAQSMPGKYTTYVIYGLFLFVLSIFIMGFLVEVPERVYADAKVMSSNPPITLNAQISGKIHIIANKPSLRCLKGQYLAVIENPANYKDVLALKSWLGQKDIWSKKSIIYELLENSYSLGEIEADFYAFKVALLKYDQLQNGRNDYKHSLSMIDKQIEANMISVKNRKELLKSYITEKEIRSFYLKSDSVLYLKNIIPKDEFDRSNIQYIETQNKILSIEQEISQTENSTVQNVIKRDQIVDGINNAQDEAKTSLNNAYHKLMSQIRNWEKTYVFIAPDECEAEFANLITEGTFVTAGEPIYNIIYRNSSYFGVAVLPSDGAGNVTKGDSVNLRMMLYPYQEYGSLRGYVERISMNSVEKGYLLYINMPNGLKSDNNHTLSFAETMYGQAEIITVRKKLIFMLLNRLKAITSSNKKQEDSMQPAIQNSPQEKSAKGINF